MLKIERVEMNEGSFLLVPMERGSIALDLFKDRINEPISLDSVVTPKYLKTKDHYFIEDFVTSFKPLSTLIEKNIVSITYVDFFKHKYNIDIQDMNQPLLRISSTDKKLLMFKPGGEAVKDKDSDDIAKRTLLFRN